MPMARDMPPNQLLIGTAAIDSAAATQYHGLRFSRAKWSRPMASGSRHMEARWGPSPQTTSVISRRGPQNPSESKRADFTSRQVGETSEHARLPESRHAIQNSVTGPSE